LEKLRPGSVALSAVKPFTSFDPVGFAIFATLREQPVSNKRALGSGGRYDDDLLFIFLWLTNLARKRNHQSRICWFEQHLNRSEGTVKIHLHNIFRKLRVSNRTALAARRLSSSVLSLEANASSEPPNFRSWRRRP
jgi:hypothetical protein